ncbi:hypothetical protein AVEN_35073-1 [Araneus ventricosus]|uniref:Uncharacterized protein n=1 Tax=Araneus ventricosus TaxID=182803 RepID=A0A4Y2JB30_ARAVE|nr:hypothetical protein AVEN_35073-1 [Araneus ventricosus]
MYRESSRAPFKYDLAKRGEKKSALRQRLLIKIRDRLSSVTRLDSAEHPLHMWTWPILNPTRSDVFPLVWCESLGRISGLQDA